MEGLRRFTFVKTTDKLFAVLPCRLVLQIGNKSSSLSAFLFIRFPHFRSPSSAAPQSYGFTVLNRDSIFMRLFYERVYSSSNFPFISSVTDSLAGRRIELNSGQYDRIFESFRRITGLLDYNTRTALFRSHDYLPRYMITHNTPLLVRSSSSFINPDFYESTLLPQLVRHVGFNKGNTITQQLANFISHSSVNSRASRSSVTFSHFIMIFDIRASVGGQVGLLDSDHPLFVLPFTFTHTTQGRLDRMGLGRDSMPNLHLLTVGEADLVGDSDSQQILTNGLVAPRESLNGTVPTDSSFAQRGMMEAHRQLVEDLIPNGGVPLGRTFFLFNSADQYSQLITTLSSRGAPAHLLHMTEEEAIAYERNEPSPQTQFQITTMQLLEQAQSPEHVAEVRNAVELINHHLQSPE